MHVANCTSSATLQIRFLPHCAVSRLILACWLMQQPLPAKLCKSKGLRKRVCPYLPRAPFPQRTWRMFLFCHMVCWGIACMLTRARTTSIARCDVKEC